MKSIFILLVFAISYNTFAQKKVNYYTGGHYGAHKPWNYVSMITTDKRGDTLYFERLVYRNKNEIKDGDVLETDRVTMLMSDENNIQVLSDTLSFNWATGPKCYKIKKKDSLEITYKDPKRINFDFEVGETRSVKPNQLTFTSVAAIELYLANCNLFEGFEKDIFMADNELRHFRVRVLGIIYFNIEGKSLRKCYDISINALDKKSLHTGKIFMDVESKIVLKREFVSNELRQKSVVNEYLIQNLK